MVSPGRRRSQPRTPWRRYMAIFPDEDARATDISAPTLFAFPHSLIRDSRPDAPDRNPRIASSTKCLWRSPRTPSGEKMQMPQSFISRPIPVLRGDPHLWPALQRHHHRLHPSASRTRLVLLPAMPLFLPLWLRPIALTGFARLALLIHVRRGPVVSSLRRHHAFSSVF
jgi:hypothetical protein